MLRWTGGGGSGEDGNEDADACRLARCTTEDDVRAENNVFHSPVSPGCLLLVAV